MANMAHCRFRNTLEDLKDCHDNMDDTPAGAEEAAARLELVRVCLAIAGDYEYLLPMRGDDERPSPAP